MKHIIEGFETQLLYTIQNRQRLMYEQLRKLRALGPLEFIDQAYTVLGAVAEQIELMDRDLRETTDRFHNYLRAMGLNAPPAPLPGAPRADIQLADGCLTIIFDGLLPFPITGSVHYIHERLDKELNNYRKEHNLPFPLFRERCAVVFLHHYNLETARHIRDYDNLERRCVTNVIASHFLMGDSPRCMISMDVLAPGAASYTEVRIMPMDQFREFVLSDQIEFSL